MGWVVERLAFLHRELPAPAAAAAPTAPSCACEPFEASRPLRVAWQGESVWGEEAGFALLEEEVARAPRHARGDRRRSDGEPAGFSAFSVHGDAAEVELVFCLPERRNGGLGGALVARALEAAHAERRAPRADRGRRRRRLQAALRAARLPHRVGAALLHALPAPARAGRLSTRRRPPAKSTAPRR